MTQLVKPFHLSPHEQDFALKANVNWDYYSNFLNTMDGWVEPDETWTYASATTFTVSGDLTARYSVGDKIRLTQTTAKYFYVAGVSFGSGVTTLTVNGGAAYSLANAAITSPSYSKMKTPNGFPFPNFVSNVIASVGNGHGSTATMIRRFTTGTTTGTDITYADSATNGATFTINTSGTYGIAYSDISTTGTVTIGISVNAASLTTTIGNTTIANGKRAQTSSSAANIITHVATSLYLTAGDIVRAHTNNNPNSTADNVIFVITKLEI